MTTPDTTICIIDYNYGHFLRSAIESALEQDTTTRVMVVDDGSTDDSRWIATAFGDRVEYRWKPNGGLSDARNFALERCDTPYLLFLDADDRIPPDFVSVTRDALMRNPRAAFAYVQLAYFTSDADVNEGFSPSTNFPSFSPERLKRGNYINAAALLRRAALTGVRFDTRLRYGLEDWDFFINLTRRGRQGILVDGTAVRYRTHHSSMGHDLQRRHWSRRATYVYILLKHWRFFRFSGAMGFASRSLKSRLHRSVPG